MRLLRLDSCGEPTLTEDFIDEAPSYAILSHTWGPDEDEVTFNDLERGSGKSKTGYGKIRFCGEQAKKDGLQYFWVDTCCIDRANNTELTEAIVSMFRWYHGSARCYAYLSDVSVRDSESPQNSSTWESAFQKSRWFTRGWTLQELIAPESVEFFSQENVWLGSKKSLERHILAITKIPAKALSGTPLIAF